MRHLMLAACALAALAIAPRASAQEIQTVERASVACVAPGPDRADCFVPGSLREVFHISRTREAWTGFEGFGRSEGLFGAGLDMGPASCVSRSVGQWDCFSMANNSALWTRHSAGGWASLGGNGPHRSRPSCVAVAADQVDCFIRDSMNILARRSHQGGRWQEWERLPGVLLSDAPHCIVVDDGSRADVAISTPIWCFARGPRDQLWMVTVPRAVGEGRAARWTNLGGTVRSYPSCVATEYGRVYCFVRGRNDWLWWKQVDPYGGTAWQTLRGVLTSEPSCVSFAPRRINCFVRGTDMAMYHNAATPNAEGALTWSGFESWGGYLTSAPVCTAYRPGLHFTEAPHERIDCYTRGTDGALYNIFWFPSGRSAWQSLGGMLLFW